MRVIISSQRAGAAVTRHDKYEKIFAIERTHSGLYAIITLLNTINVIGARDTRNARVVRASLKADPRAIFRTSRDGESWKIQPISVRNNLPKQLVRMQIGQVIAI